MGRMRPEDGGAPQGPGSGDPQRHAQRVLSSGAFWLLLGIESHHGHPYLLGHTDVLTSSQAHFAILL